MNEALLVMTSACMIQFAGGIPKPLLDHTWNSIGGERIIKQLDERYLNEEVRIWGGNIAIGAQVIFQQKFIIKTDF